MSVYFIANILVTDESVYQKYLDACDNVFSKYKGVYLAVDGNPKLLEGEYTYSKSVIIEFKSEKDFNDWYHSPEYSKIKEFRLAGAKCDSVLVNGISKDFPIKRTDGKDPDFIKLAKALDIELWEMYPGIQQNYDALNVLPFDAPAVVIYDGGKPVACGGVKLYEETRFEAKRVYVEKAYRGKGLAKTIMKELEQISIENGASEIILETGIKQIAAIKLYEGLGYVRIPNFGKYAGDDNSVCLKKIL